jgi:4-hydroxythreonine-4-phosphate dehydrogenase
MTTSRTAKPVIGITLGDPAGIGPEVIRSALASPHLPADFEFEVVGEATGHVPGSPTKESAQSAAAALETAAKHLHSGRWQAVVTGPVSKKGLHDVGYDYPGQTEFFAARAGVENYAMCLTGGGLTVALVTCHVPIARVAGLLKKEEILRVGTLLAEFLRQRGCQYPKIAVAGLNPHAGEGGDIGREEIEIIAPAVLALEKSGKAEFTGPLPPDTIFQQAVAGTFDGVLCMYHDQGLIPLKFHAFDQGVNVTLGLPFVRTSPDHGTAFGIAGKGTARPDSMIAAIHLAATILRSGGARKSSQPAT